MREDISRVISISLISRLLPYRLRGLYPCLCLSSRLYSILHVMSVSLYTRYRSCGLLDPVSVNIIMLFLNCLYSILYSNIR